jgi:hypothetical protein
MTAYYSGRRRCSMPFGLLYLRALLPAHLGDADLSLDLLYELQSYCQQQMTDHSPCTNQQESPLIPALGNSCQSQDRQQQQQQHLPPDERIADAGPGVGDQSPKDMIQAQNSFMQQQQQQPYHPNHKTNLPSKFPTSQAPTPAAPQLGDVWYQRWQGVSCQLISHHWQQHSVAAAFAQLELLLAAAPTNVLLWSLAGRMQLQLRLGAAAHRSFETAQQLVQQESKKLQQQQQQQQQLQTDHHQQHDMSSSCSSLGAAAAAVKRSPATSTPSWELGLLQQAVLLNWGCYHALANDMEAAAASFESVRGVLEEPEQRPGLNNCSNLVSVAAANSAVCLMYSSQLTEAISAIEAGLQGDQPLLLQVSLSLLWAACQSSGGVCELWRHTLCKANVASSNGFISRSFIQARRRRCPVISGPPLLIWSPCRSEGLRCLLLAQVQGLWCVVGVACRAHWQPAAYLYSTTSHT